MPPPTSAADVLKELQKQFAEFARALRSELGGALSEANVALGKLGRSLNFSHLVAAAESQLAALKKFGESFRDFGKVVKEIAQPFLKFGDLFKKLGDLFKPVTDKMREFGLTAKFLVIGAFEKLGESLKPLTDTFREWGLNAKFLVGGALEKLGELIPQGLENFAAKLAGGLGTALGGSIGGGLGALGTAGKAFGAVGMAAAQAAGAVIDFGNQIASFVWLASPGAFQQWVMVLEDLQAVIGQAFAPILQIATAVIRSAADALQTLVPIGGAVATAVKPIIGILTSYFQMAAYMLQPFLRVADVLAPVANRLGQALGAVYQAVQPLFNLVAVFRPGRGLTAARVPARPRQQCSSPASASNSSSRDSQTSSHSFCTTGSSSL